MALLAAGADVLPQVARPEDAAFLQRMRSAIRLDEDLQKPFVYVENRRDVRVTALGKVVVGPARTFEVWPAAEPGGTYKRLIAVDGQPLDRAELARRDADHRRDLEREALREEREGPAQRTRRAEGAEGARRESLAILADALDVFEPVVIGRDILGGEPVVIVSMSPRPDVRVRTREGSWMKRFVGQAWFAERDAELVRLDVHAVGDVTIGWGLIGRISSGTRIVVDRRRLGAQWVPARRSIQAAGRTLLFRPFDLDLVTEYTDYRER